MKRNKPQITIEDGIVFLTQDLKGLGLYDKAKAIRQFVNDTKIIEDYVDELIKGILFKNGITLVSKSECSLKCAFDSLKEKGKEIRVKDFYGGREMWRGRFIETKNEITVMLEDNRYLQAGVKVEEVDYVPSNIDEH